MTRGRGASRARSAGALAALVFLVALNLRPSITAVGPLLPQIGADLGIDKPTQGLLGALPLIAFGVVSPLVHHVSRRLGPDRTMFLALLVLTAGTVVRSYTGIAGLWIGTAILGSAIAVSNVLMPLLVKRDYSTRISLATGLYSTCLNVAAGVASSVAVPLSVVAGWQGGLAFWAIPAFLVAMLWITRLRVRPAATPAAPPDASTPDASAVSRAPAPRPISVWRQPTAWLLTTFMAMQSTAFYVIVTWLPTIEASSGIAPERSGIHLLLFQAVGALAGLAIPHLMRRTESQVPATLAASVPLFIGILGLLLLPGLGAVWAVIAGLGISASFVVALSLVSMRGRNPHETTSLSGMVQSLGYLAAAVGPVVAGYLAQLTGGWTASMAMLAIIAGLQIVVALFVGRPSATLR